MLFNAVRNTKSHKERSFVCLSQQNARQQLAKMDGLQRGIKEGALLFPDLCNRWRGPAVCEFNRALGRGLTCCTQVLTGRIQPSSPTSVPTQHLKVSFHPSGAICSLSAAPLKLWQPKDSHLLLSRCRKRRKVLKLRRSAFPNPVRGRAFWTGV